MRVALQVDKAPLHNLPFRFWHLSALGGAMLRKSSRFWQFYRNHITGCCAGGGLLATVALENAAACVEQLQQLGYKDAAVIGQIQELQQQAAVSPTEPAVLIELRH